jgi:hypothetical protein
MAPPVMRHRVFTNFTADSQGIKPSRRSSQRLLREIGAGAGSCDEGLPLKYFDPRALRTRSRTSAWRRD